MPNIITMEGRRFYARGSDKFLRRLEKAKWLIFKTGGTHARTTKVDRVIKFLKYCDSVAGPYVQDVLDRREQAISGSVAATSDMDIPAPDGYEYRDYQKAGIEFMSQRYGSLNADVPRLGKTIQTYGVANVLVREKAFDRPLRMLVICPANAKIGWVREGNRWLVENASVGYVSGQSDKGNPKTDVLAINWELLKHHYDYLVSVDWDIVVCDEAHKLGSLKAERTKISYGRPIKGRDGTITARYHFICLTGTPIYARPIQLWPMLQKLDPRDIGANWKKFVYRYCDAKHTPWGLDTSGSSNMEELQLHMRSNFMIRRGKSDVLTELPPVRQSIYLPKTGLTKLINDEKSAFQQNLDALVGLLNEGGADVKGTIFEDDGEVKGKGPEARRELSLRKVPLVKDFVDDLLLSEEKVVVFYYHRDPLRKFYESYDGDMVARIWGGMGDVQREAERVRFQEDPACRVMVANIVAASEAIEMSAANVAVFAEFSRSVASEYSQAEERIWLPTKTEPLGIYWLIIEDSIEAQLVEEVLLPRMDDIDRFSNQSHLVAN